MPRDTVLFVQLGSRNEDSPFRCPNLFRPCEDGGPRRCFGCLKHVQGFWPVEQRILTFLVGYVSGVGERRLPHACLPLRPPILQSEALDVDLCEQRGRLHAT